MSKGSSKARDSSKGSSKLSDSDSETSIKEVGELEDVPPKQTSKQLNNN